MTRQNTRHADETAFGANTEVLNEMPCGFGTSPVSSVVVKLEQAKKKMSPRGFAPVSH
jgi:hypothetical protein